jgi:hypothetical protein
MQRGHSCRRNVRQECLTYINLIQTYTIKVIQASSASWNTCRYTALKIVVKYPGGRILLCRQIIFFTFYNQGLRSAAGALTIFVKNYMHLIVSIVNMTILYSAQLKI